VTIPALIQHCEEWTWAPVRVSDTVVSFAKCGPCPHGSVCGACVVDHVVLSGAPGKEISVVGPVESSVADGAHLTFEGTVDYSAERFTGRPCMIRRTTVDRFPF
jgi:hypothetical protein